MQSGLFLVCFLVSSLGTIAGFGGGVFLVPIMVMVFDVPINHAIGVTALSLFPSSFLSTVLNARKKNIDFKLMVLLELPTILGAVAGAHLTTLLPTKPLEIVFAVFLILIAWRMLRAGRTAGMLSKAVARLNDLEPAIKNRHYRVGVWAASCFGMVAGVIAGTFGIGGGILKTPIMIHVFRVPVRTATGTALCMIVFTSLSSGISHYHLGHVAPSLLLPCATGFLGGALAGNSLGFHFSDENLKQIVAGSIALAGVAVLFHVLLIS